MTPRVAVVVPYHAEPLEQLRQCFASVREQAGVKPLLIAVGDGLPREEAFDFVPAEPPTVRLVLPTAHADYGCVARTVGSIEAMSRGCEFVQYLDADNWLAPNHLAEMLARWTETGAAVVTASRTLVRVDGSELYRDPENDGKVFVDTSCFFLSQRAFGYLPLWSFIPRQYGAICDRIFWQVLRETVKTSHLTFAHCSTPTVFYRTRYAVHYKAIGEAPPADARGIVRLPAGRVTIGAPYHVNLEVL
jgi:hypothetical protein